MERREDVAVKVTAEAVDRLDMLRSEWEARNGASITRKGMLGMLIHSRWNELDGAGLLPKE